MELARLEDYPREGKKLLTLREPPPVKRGEIRLIDKGGSKKELDVNTVEWAFSCQRGKKEGQIDSVYETGHTSGVKRKGGTSCVDDKGPSDGRPGKSRFRFIKAEKKLPESSGGVRISEQSHRPRSRKDLDWNERCFILNGGFHGEGL